MSLYLVMNLMRKLFNCQICFVCLHYDYDLIIFSILKTLFKDSENGQEIADSKHTEKARRTLSPSKTNMFTLLVQC